MESNKQMLLLLFARGKSYGSGTTESLSGIHICRFSICIINDITVHCSSAKDWDSETETSSTPWVVRCPLDLKSSSTSSTLSLPLSCSAWGCRRVKAVKRQEDWDCIIHIKKPELSAIINDFPIILSLSLVLPLSLSFSAPHLINELYWHDRQK